MEEKWKKLIKENNKEYILLYLKFLCSIRNNLSKVFKEQISKDIKNIFYYEDIYIYIQLLGE